MHMVERPPARAVTVAEAADALNVHKATIRRMVRDGRLPALRLGPPPHGHLRVHLPAFPPSVEIEERR